MRVSGSINRRKNSRLWIARFYDLEGKRREKGFPTKRAAQELLADLTRRNVSDRGYVYIEELVNEFLEACREGRDGKEPLTNDTIRCYENYLTKWVLPVWKGRAVRELTSNDARALLRTLLAKANSRRTAQQCFSITKTMLRWAQSRELIEKNPAEFLSISTRREDYDPDRRVRIPTKSEMAKLLRSAEALSRSESRSRRRAWSTYYPLFLTLLYLGVRSSEAFGLKFSDFSNNYSTVEIRRRVEASSSYAQSVAQRVSVPKSKNSVRRLFVPSELSAEIIRLHQINKMKNGFIFSTQSGFPLNYSNVLNRMWKVLLNEAGASGYGMHSLRHFYASILMEQGKTHEASKLLGHSTTNFTMDTYGHLLDDGGKRMRNLAEEVRHLIRDTSF